MIDTATVGHSVMFSKTGSVSLCYNFHSYLSLTPLYTPMVELTEHLRARETMDYAPLLDQILAKKAELAAL